MSRRSRRWQAAILQALQTREVFPLSAYFANRLGGLLPAEDAALHRAAHALHRKGQCQLARLWTEGRRQLVLVVGRPDATVNGLPLEMLSVELQQP
jgi:hypothetical protein